MKFINVQKRGHLAPIEKDFNWTDSFLAFIFKCKVVAVVLLRFGLKIQTEYEMSLVQSLITRCQLGQGSGRIS